MSLSPEDKARIDESAARWRDFGTNRMTEIMLRAPGTVSPHIDKASSWLLGGTTATIVLLVTNAERVLQVLRIPDFQVALVILCVSGALGAMAKVCAVYASLRTDIAAQLSAESERLLDEINRNSESLRNVAEENQYPYKADPDFRAAMVRFTQAYPHWWQWAVRRQIESSDDDPLIAFSKITRGVFFQGLWTTLQALSYACFVLWIAFAVGSASWT